MGFDDERIICEGKDGGFKIVFTNKRVCVLEAQQATSWEQVPNPIYKLNVYYPLEMIREIYTKSEEVFRSLRMVAILDDGIRLECSFTLGEWETVDAYWEGPGTSRSSSPLEKANTDYWVNVVKRAVSARSARVTLP